MEDVKTYLDRVYSENESAIEDEKWNGRVHNWQNYIPEELANGWDKLSVETKAAIYLVCEERASSEEWD